MAPRKALLGWALALGIVAAGSVQAQPRVNYAVTYMELGAGATSSGRQILGAYAAGSRKEKGNLLFEVLQETGRPSRFAILEAWNNREALDTHYHGRNVSRILHRLDTMRVAPDDRRIYEGLFVSAPGNQTASGRLYVMTHVDVMPPYKDGCAVLLKAMRSQTPRDHGNLAYDVLRQEGELNHFTVAEVWVSRQDFDAHVAAAHTALFRKKLLPMTGALYDERLFRDIP